MYSKELPLISKLSGVLTGFRVLPSDGVGVTELNLMGSVYNAESKTAVDLTGITVDPNVGDKYLVMATGDNLVKTKTTPPSVDEILLCTFGFVYDPYDQSRDGEILGIPYDWATKDLAKPSFLWHPVAIDNPEAKLAVENFQTGNVPYHLPNSGLTGCALDKEDMTLIAGTEPTDNYRLASNTIVEGLYLDGGSLIVDSGCKDSLAKNFILEGNDILFYFMIKSSKGDGWEDSENVVLENITFSFFDTIPEVWNSNADGTKPPAGVTFKNIKAYNCPNDPFKIERGVTYDGFEAYQLGYKKYSHCDGFQGSGAYNHVQEGGIIKKGTLWMPHPESVNPTIGQEGEVNGCIYLDGDFGPEDSVDRVAIRDVLIEDCFFNGGIHSLWVYNHSGDNWKIRDVKFRNIMLGLDWGRGFAADVASSSFPESTGGQGISEWVNIRRVDNGELIEKPSATTPVIKY